MTIQNGQAHESCEVKGEDQTHSSSRLSPMPVFGVDEAFAVVSVSIGRTTPLQNFCNVKNDITIEMPCRPDALYPTFDAVVGECLRRFGKQLANAVMQRPTKNTINSAPRNSDLETLLAYQDFKTGVWAKTGVSIGQTRQTSTRFEFVRTEISIKLPVPQSDVGLWSSKLEEVAGELLQHLNTEIGYLELEKVTSEENTDAVNY